MRRSLTAAAMAACVAAGALAGTTFGGPLPAGAADPSELAGTPRADVTAWVDEALQGLVDDGTITADQAEAVHQALRDARPSWSGFDGRGRGERLDRVAEVLGLSVDELREALAGGASLSDLADQHDVDIEALAAALLAPLEERLESLVSEGRITEERADTIRARAAERLTARLDGDTALWHRGEHRGGELWSGEHRGGELWSGEHRSREVPRWRERAAAGRL